MKKPVIGLVPIVDPAQNRYGMTPAYCKAVEGAGGLPLMLPLTADSDDLAQLVELCDGILFTGGPDIHPARYGEETLPACGTIVPERDAMEDALLQAALAADKPVLGICRGIQVLNVSLGGTLWQDLPSQYGETVGHSQPEPYDQPCHAVTVLADTPLAALLGEGEIAVTSRHHQAIKELADPLRAMATSPDGLVEAVWMPGKRFVWGVQWHPESIFSTSPESQKLFAAFVEQCR